MADKQVPLSIVLKFVDNATSGIKAFKDHIGAITTPVKQLGASFSGLAKEAGLPSIVDGFKGVGGAVKDLAGKLVVVGGFAAGAAAEILHLVGEFDDLGDLADRLGVHVDFLAQLRFAAERSGASVEQLDEGLQTFTTNLGQARAGTGKMVKFLQTVSPALLAQLKATKSNEEAVLLMADAFGKVKDSSKRAALAARTGFGPALAPLLAQGSKGVAELMDRFHELAGNQGDAAEAAGATDDALKDLKAATQGVKAALVSGLAPAVKVVVDRLRDWFVAHREDIRQWAADIGQKLPGAIDKVVTSVGEAVRWVTKIVDSIGGLKVIAAGAAAVLVGPLVGAFVKLGAVMLTTPFGIVLAGLAAITALAISTTSEIQKFRAALDTKNEVKLQDAADKASKMSEAAFNAAGPKRASAFETTTPSSQGPFSRNLPLGPERNLQPAGLAGPRLFTSREAQAHITIDIANAPPGTRVKTDPRSTAEVDLSVGYQMGGL